MKFKRRLASIGVSLADRVVYLAGSSDIEGTTINDTIYHSSDPLLACGSLLRGSVRIRVTSPCSFRHLRVVLLGVLRTQAIRKAGPEDNGLPAQRYENVRHEVNILMGRPPHFNAGVHELPFAVLLPPDLQPSFRCPYGRQEYTVCALAEEVDGRFRTSRPESVSLLAPGDMIDGPGSFVDAVTYNPSLGYISATIHCDIPSVGAQGFLQLDMPAPKPDISIVSIRVVLVQTVQVTSAKGAILVRTSEKQLACLYNAKSVVAEATPGAKRAYVPRWKAGEPVSVSQLVMLPTHETFAPSTNALKLSHKKESQLKMTVSHHAVIKIRFQPSASETLKEVTITSRNVSLISCKCLPNSLVLPPYTPKDAGLSQDSNETLTWLQLSRQKAQSAAGLDDCTCFNAKVFIQHPVSGEKAGMPLAIPVKATTALAECGIVNHTA